MVKKLFYRAALLDFPNFIGPNGSNSESIMSHFAAVVRLKNNYMCILEECRIGFFVEEIKPTVLNASPVLCWF